MLSEFIAQEEKVERQVYRDEIYKDAGMRK